MATIVPVNRVNGRAYKVIVRPRGVTPYSKTFKTKKAAQCWAKQQEAVADLLAAGADLKTLGMTLADLCDRYLQQRWHGKDQGRPYHVRWWREQLGDRPVQNLTKREVRDKLREYKAGKVQRYNGAEANGKAKLKETDRSRAPASVNRLRGALESVLKYGREEHDLTADPCKDIPKEPEDNKRKRYLNEAERTALLKACRESTWHRLWLLVAMAMTSGARLGEMLGLRYRDLDLANNRALLLDTKNGETRRIHLTDEVVAEIQGFPSPLNRDALLFGSDTKPLKKTEPLKPKKTDKPFEFRKLWNEAVKTAGIEIGEGKDKFVFHSLRHTAASYLANQGMSLPEIGAVLGHKSQASTGRYAHLCDDNANKLVRTVSSKMLHGTGESNG